MDTITKSMKFSNWPYWVRGGVIGLFIWILFVTEALIFRSFLSGNAWEIFICAVNGIVSGAYCDYDYHGPKIGDFVEPIFRLVMIGMVAGFLYGKFKNRKQKK